MKTPNQIHADPGWSGILTLTSLALLTALAVAWEPSALQAAIVPIAVLGDPAPDGSGKLNNFGRPSINNAGQVRFTSQNFDTLGESPDRTR